MSSTLITEVLILEHLIAGAIAMTVWNRKGGSADRGFIVGAIFGILGALILAIAKPNRRQREHSSLVPCPNCLEFIKLDARVCRYCQRDAHPEVSADSPHVMSL